MTAASLAFCGVVLGWCGNWWYRSRPAIGWDSTQVELATRGAEDRLQLLYDGRSVPRVTVGTLSIRNLGNTAIRWGQDVDGEVGVTVSPPADASLLKFSVSPQTPVGVGAVTGPPGPSGARLAFRSLNPGEALVAEYAHTGPKTAEPDVRMRCFGFGLCHYWPQLRSAGLLVPLAALLGLALVALRLTGARRPFGRYTDKVRDGLSWFFSMVLVTALFSLVQAPWRAAAPYVYAEAGEFAGVLAALAIANKLGVPWPVEQAGGRPTDEPGRPEG